MFWHNVLTCTTQKHFVWHSMDFTPFQASISFFYLQQTWGTQRFSDAFRRYRNRKLTRMGYPFQSQAFQKIVLNFYTSLWYLKRFYEGLYKTIWCTTKKFGKLRLIFSLRPRSGREWSKWFVNLLELQWNLYKADTL